MTRELHVYDHNGMIAVLFVDPDGAVEAFEAAACACADADVFRDF
jgi:hypothetical protein